MNLLFNFIGGILVKKSMILLLSVLLVVSLMTVGCQTKIKQSEKPEVINISYSTRPINIPTIVALEKKTFEEEFAKEGIEVKWHELAGPETTEALAAKSIDIATSLNYVTGIVTKAAGNNIEFISSFSKFPDAIGLVAGTDSGIKSVADLKGKKIALQKGTMLHEMLIKALLQENMTTADVEIVDMPSTDAINVVMQNQVDAAILPDPLLMKALSTKKVNLICTANGLISGQTFIAVRTEFAEKYPDVTRKFLSIHKDILNWSEENTEEALNMVSKVNDMDINAVKALDPKFNFDMEMNENIVSELKDSALLLKENGFLKDDVNIDDLVDGLVNSSYLSEK